MKIKRSLTMAVGLCAAGLAASQSAQAYVYAGSELTISNLVITIEGQDDQSISGFGFSTSTSSELNGATAGDADSCGSEGTIFANNCSVSPVLKSDVANAPGSEELRADTDYTLSGTTDKTYANANAEITQAELVNFVPTTIKSVSEANLVYDGNASASTSVQSNTNLALEFEAAGGATVTLTFNATLDQFAEINNAAVGPTPTFDANAQYSSGVEASLVPTTPSGTTASWSSNGTSNDCTTAANPGCSDPADPLILSITQSTSAGIDGFGPFGDPSDVSNGGTAAFEIVLSTPTCTATSGVCRYTLNLAATTGVVVRNSVPVPGTLGLLGIGLLAASRLRGRKQAKA